MTFPLDIASRASNLSERLLIVDALQERQVCISPGTELSPFDVWKINKLAGQLATLFLKEALYWKSLAKYTEEYLINALTAYRLFDVDLKNLPESAKSLYAEMHHAWLPTYQEALQAIDLPDEKALTAAWYEPEIYYGKFAKACEPFLAQLHRELTSACTKANASLHLDLFDPQLIEDVQHQLLKRFELALAWTIETDAKVYCAYYHIDKAGTTSDDYLHYLNATFADQKAYHRFYLRFPMLGRWLAQVTR
ncbi:MAG: type 2 lanthipeptide synthetase LanM family protein, partial [Ktedonobacteraceae bacterium]